MLLLLPSVHSVQHILAVSPSLAAPAVGPMSLYVLTPNLPFLVLLAIVRKAA